MSDIRVSEVSSEGILREVGSFNPSNCPQFILDITHYRDDGTCKCDDKNEVIMSEWGYEWNEESRRWQ